MRPIILNEKDCIKSCTLIDDGGKDKLVLCTCKPAGHVKITDADGRVFGEVGNHGEPYDLCTHIFYLPEESILRPMTVSFFDNDRRPPRFYDENAEINQTVLSPENIVTTDRGTFIAESDHHITPESITEAEVCDGVKYQILNCKNASGAPVRVFALFVDPKKAEISVGTANDGYAPNTEIQTVKGQAESAIANGRAVVAATNADFFDMFGNNAPSGLCVKDGRFLSNPDTKRSFFGADLNGTPIISSFAEAPELVGQLKSAVGGREIFLRDGELAEISLCEPFSYVCHPRTSAGIREDGTVILMVVDGRLPELSNGASIVDLGRLMQYFGAKKAINLDGGGSSTFLVNIDGEMTMLNRPADLHRPTEPLIRPIFNSVQIIKR